MTASRPDPPQRLRRLSDETGFALIAALATVLITAVLASAAVAVAVQTSGFSNRDVRGKNALEAAEAGLQVALYRINMLEPSNSNCVGDAVSAPPSSGWCASSSTTLGNGSSYQYFTTPALGTGATCVGNVVSNTLGVTNRCITAVGMANGIVARSQIRVAAFAAEPLFPVAGITGLTGITNSNNASINGWEASNKTIASSNNVKITGDIELGPAGNYTYSNNASDPPQAKLSSPIVLDPIDPGTSATTNSDYRISNDLNNPSKPTAPYDQASGKVTFSATTRALTLSNNASITLGGSLYNFCSLSVSNNAAINLAPGVSTEIIIDSPSDPGSGCPAGSGTLNASNNVTWTNPSDNPTALQIYVYGSSTAGQNTVAFSNNGVFYGVLYAPNSTIDLSNNAAFDGAISGYQVALSNNFQFNWSATAGTLQATAEGLYYRTAWAQCSSVYAASAPGANCG